MTQVEHKVYVSLLEILKNKLPFNVSNVARVAKVPRQTVYNIIERRTFQDLEKYKNKEN